jgi:hypothetical protein
MPRLCEFYPGICLTTEEKARKNLSQGKKILSQSTVYTLSQNTVYNMHRGTEENGEELSRDSVPAQPRTGHSPAPPEQTWTDSKQRQPTFVQRQLRKAIFQPVFLLLT